jgi:hypothetical protein
MIAWKSSGNSISRVTRSREANDSPFVPARDARGLIPGFPVFDIRARKSVEPPLRQD